MVCFRIIASSRHGWVGALLKRLKNTWFRCSCYPSKYFFFLISPTSRNAVDKTSGDLTRCALRWTPRRQPAGGREEPQPPTLGTPLFVGGKSHLTRNNPQLRMQQETCNCRSRISGLDIEDVFMTLREMDAQTRKQLSYIQTELQLHSNSRLIWHDNHNIHTVDPFGNPLSSQHTLHTEIFSSRLPKRR